MHINQLIFSLIDNLTTVTLFFFIIAITVRVFFNVILNSRELFYLFVIHSIVYIGCILLFNIFYSSLVIIPMLLILKIKKAMATLNFMVQISAMIEVMTSLS